MEEWVPVAVQDVWARSAPASVAMSKEVILVKYRESTLEELGVSSEQVKEMSLRKKRTRSDGK